MTNRATRARVGSGQSQGLGHSRGASVDQHGIGAEVKILFHPSEILAALFARPAVATGGLATRRAHKLLGRKRGGPDLSGEEVDRAENERGVNGEAAGEFAHAGSLAEGGRAMPANNQISFCLTNQKFFPQNAGRVFWAALESRKSEGGLYRHADQE